MMMRRHFHIATYPFVLLLGALVSGILLQQQLPFFSGIYWLSGCLFFLMLSWLQHHLSSIKSLIIISRNVLLFLAFSTFGATVGYYQNIQNDARWYGHFLKETTALKVQVTQPPIAKTKTDLLWASVKSICKNGHWIEAKGDIKLYLYKGEDSIKIQPGQTLIIPNELTEITTSGNPFAFDQKQYANRRDIYHQCFLSPDQLMVYKHERVQASFISTLRTAIQTAIHKNVQEPTTKGLIDAMLLNDRTDLDADLQQAYVTTGIIHILAISGIHVLLLAGILLWIIEKIPIRHLQRWKYMVALLVVWLYIAITGFPPSADRAAVMFTIYALGISFNKDRVPLNTWAAAGFLLLCYNPYWLYDVGVQLSFLAVLSILLFYKSVANWWQPKKRFVKSLWQMIAMSIAVQILVFPLVIYYFNQFPILAFLANIPAGLYSTILMIGAIVIIILHSIGIGCLWIGNILAIITKGFNAFVVLLSSISPESFRMLFIDGIDYWLMMLAIIFCCIFFYYKNKKQLIIGLSFALLLVAVFIRKDIAALHQARIVVYNLNKESQVDLFIGKRNEHLYPTNGSQYKYAIKPAQLGFRTTTEITDTVDHLFSIHGKHILIMQEGQLQEHTSFPIDVLIISKDCLFEPEKWFQTFHPKKIIIDGSVSRTKAIRWKSMLAQAGAQVHAVTTDGAWMYPSL